MSVTSTSGAKPCFLSSLRMSFAAALASRRRCTRRSRTSPSSSTARQSQNRLPPIRTAISSRCQTRGGPRTSAAKFLGEQRPELQHPSSDRFVRDIQPALGEQIFDIAEAEGEAKVQPHRVPDDVRRELVVSKRDRCHSPSLGTDPSRESSRVNSRRGAWQRSSPSSRRPDTLPTAGRS